MCQTQCYLKTCLLLILTIISLRLKGTFFSYLDSFQLLFNAASGMFKWEGAVEIQPWFSCKGTHSSLKPNVFKCWEQKGCGYGRKKMFTLEKSIRSPSNWTRNKNSALHHFFTRLHIVMWMKNYCREKHLYFYCYCQMPSMSKNIFHYTTAYRHFKTCFLKKLYYALKVHNNHVKQLYFSKKWCVL